MKVLAQCPDVSRPTQLSNGKVTGSGFGAHIPELSGYLSRYSTIFLISCGRGSPR